MYQLTTAERAQIWYQGLINAIVSLQEMPRRCAIAREDAFFSQDIRQLLYGQGKQTYRILFTVLDNQPLPESENSAHSSSVTADNR